MKHPHKGSHTRLQSLREIPFVYMTERELEDTFDDSFRDIDEELLDDARAGRDDKLVFVCCLLLAPGQPLHLVYSAPEYGDGEGSREIIDFVARVSRLKLLHPGEQLGIQAFEADLPELLAARPIEDKA